MDLQHPVTVQDIADLINAKVIGDPTIEINSINEIHKVKHGSLTFVDLDKYYDRALYSAASAIIVHKLVDCPPGKAILLSDTPFKAYNSLAIRFRPFVPLTATISDTAVIGEGTILEPNVIIGHHVKIGKNCLIRSNVNILDYTEIGDNCIIHNGTIIGSDAFYFKKTGETYERWQTIGRVIIQDDVEIGAACTIDRGVSGDTIIGQGTKLDNMVHIGHGVVIGKNCLLAAQVGIAGKTILQDNVTLFGQVGVSKSLVIGEGAMVMAQSGVSKSLQGGRVYFGSPAADKQQRFREIIALRRLPDILHDIDVNAGKKQQELSAVELLGPDFHIEE